MNAITVSNEHKTNSKNIADVFGKSHRNITRDIKSLDCSDEFRALNFEQSYYLSAQNKKLSCVEMTKDGFAFLCMGFTGKKAAKFKEAYIAEFNRMAATLNSISDRINKLETDRVEMKKVGSKWSEIGREIKRSKKIHIEQSKKLIDEVQIKLEF